MRGRRKAIAVVMLSTSLSRLRKWRAQPIRKVTAVTVPALRRAGPFYCRVLRGESWMKAMASSGASSVIRATVISSQPSSP